MTLPGAIVIGTDTPIGLTVIRELGGHGVPVHGVGRPRSLGAASRHCRGFTVRPRAPIADWLPGLISQTGAGAVFAISEGDLVALAALPPVIQGCVILTPRAGPLATVLDKQRTLATARLLGIATPPSWQPEAGADFAAHAATLRYPVVAKWRDPAAIAPALEAAGLPLVKAEFALDKDALLALLDRYRAIGDWPLIQQYCPGTGLGQMIHMHAGVATLTFQHRRLREWPPEGGVSTDCAAEPRARHTAQMEKSIALLAAIGWEGPAMVEYRFDAATGSYWLMEINGRFWGSLPLASQSGAHFAWEAYRRMVLGDPTPAPVPRDGGRARYLLPATRRLGRVLFARHRIADPMFVARPLADLAAYAGGFVDPRLGHYVISLSDPGPMLSDVRTIVGKLSRRGAAPPE